MSETIPSIAPANAPTVSPFASSKNIVAVASGKGGVGKTWLSITLCQALARMGKSILLFDGDLGMANVDIQLGLMPERDLGAVVEGKITLENAVTKYDEGGFSILAGRSGSGTLGTLSTQRLNDLRNHVVEIAKKYDNVILDLGAGADRTVQQLAGPARTTLVVVTDEPTSITDGYAFIKLAVRLNPNTDIRVIVNMAATLAEGEKTYETIRKACQTFLNYSPTLCGIVRRDPKVRDAIRSQTPILLRSPTSDAALDVEALASRLYDSL